MEKCTVDPTSVVPSSSTEQEAKDTLRLPAEPSASAADKGSMVRISSNANNLFKTRRPPFFQAKNVKPATYSFFTLLSAVTGCRDRCFSRSGVGRKLRGKDLDCVAFGRAAFSV